MKAVRRKSAPLRSRQHHLLCPFVKHDFDKSSAHREVHPAPLEAMARSSERPRVRRELARVFDRLLAPPRARAPGGLVVDDNPACLGLKEKVGPAVEDLAVVLDQLEGMLDQHAAGPETGVEGPSEASCTLHRIGGRHRSLPGARADESDPPTDARLSSSSSGTVRATGPRCGRGSPSAHLIKIPRTKRDRHQSNDTVADPEVSRSQRQELPRRDSPARQALSHHSRTKAPWVDGKRPDLKDTGESDATLGTD